MSMLYVWNDLLEGGEITVPYTETSDRETIELIRSKHKPISIFRQMNEKEIREAPADIGKFVLIWNLSENTDN